MSFVTEVCVIIKLASPAAPEELVDEDENGRVRGGIGVGSCCNALIPPAVAAGTFEARGGLRGLLLRRGFFRIAEARPSGIPSSSSPTSHSSSTSKTDEDGKSSNGDFGAISALAPCSLTVVVELAAGYRNPLPLPLLALREGGSARNGAGGVEVIGLSAATCGPGPVCRLGEGAARPTSAPLAFEVVNGEGARERDREEVRLPRG